MTTRQANISLIRADGKRGVDFDSPQTLQLFLDYIRGVNDPSTSYFIPVLENGGVIPEDRPEHENYNPNFDALLRRMGIVAYSIPNVMRAHFLVTFQGGANMQMTWWETTPSDRKRDFIAYLKKAANIKNLPAPLLEDQEKLEFLIIPILEKGDGWIPEEMTDIIRLAQTWDMTNHQLADKIHQLWKRMTKQLSANQAGRIVNRSAGTMRRWARENKLHAGVDNKGHWYFTREVLISYFS